MQIQKYLVISPQEREDEKISERKHCQNINRSSVGKGSMGNIFPNYSVMRLYYLIMKNVFKQKRYGKN